MKIIIVSDIKGKSKSIIPYGLNLAKHLQCEVNIIHAIDSRTQQGLHSPYADSQSITPGNKLSQAEIVMREKNTTQTELDKMLSKEASKLNFPLKIKIVIQANTIKASINMAIRNVSSYIILVNSEADNYIFHSRNEILETFKNNLSTVILVPSGMVFNGLNQVLLITDFRPNKGFERLTFKASFLNRFNNIEIYAVDVSDPKDYIKKESQSKAWLQAVGSSIFSTALRTRILTGDDYFGSLYKYIQQMNPDLILPHKQKAGLLRVHPQKRLVKYLLDNIKQPILYSL